MTMPTGAALAPLPPIDRPCGKCGSDQRTLVWVPSADKGAAGPLIRLDPRDHLQVTCSVCGFVWPAAPVDASDDPATDRA